MTAKQSKLSTAELFQQTKQQLALMKREGLEWHELMPLTLRQTRFPALFEQVSRSDNHTK